ncbi:unnamed protein product [Prorocentrum cordatum]|uniref:Uncharacterized protein n=1 Tax=Prorocentrum cordatum TaxID=2364126 RepID=A0ABN9YA91_9DINO|nr:unnamed protein product [Polarella glacialis]
MDVLEAISALSEKMDKMARKSDIEDLKVNFDAFRKEVMVDVKVTVSEAVDPLKHLCYELGSRVSALEPQSPVSDADARTIKELQSSVLRMHPVRRRVALVGWPDDVGADARIAKMEVAKAFLSNVSLSSIELNIVSNKSMIKPAPAELQRKWRYAMRTAQELIKAYTLADGKEARIDFEADGSQNRLVIVNRTAAFKQ